MDHHTPMYLAGVNQLTSPSVLGSLRFRIKFDSTKPPALSLRVMVRHGVTKGVLRTTGVGLPGVSAARSTPFSPCSKFIPA